MSEALKFTLAQTDTHEFFLFIENAINRILICSKLIIGRHCVGNNKYRMRKRKRIEKPFQCAENVR